MKAYDIFKSLLAVAIVFVTLGSSAHATYRVKWFAPGSATFVLAVDSRVNTADFNGDGGLDLIFIDSQTGVITVLNGKDGQMLWSSPAVLGRSIIQVGNTDNDIFPEILTTIITSQNGFGSFQLLDGQNGEIEHTWGLDSGAVALFVDVDSDDMYEIIYKPSNSFGEVGCIEYSMSTGVGGELNGDVTLESFELSQNYPNPFNPETTIEYNVTNKSQVTLTIYNTLGQVVNVLVDNEQSAGSYSVKWNGLDITGSRLATGIYFYRLKVGPEQSSKKMLMLK